MNRRPRLFDVFLFYNELDLLEIRLRELYSKVDYFVITECYQTFSGKKKPMYFFENRHRYAKYKGKIIHNAVGANELLEMSSAPWNAYTTNGTETRPYKHNGRAPMRLHASLKREISHRDAAVRGLIHKASDDDIVMLSDVDELPNVSAIDRMMASTLTAPSYLEMAWYLYYLDNKVSLPWYGTVVFRFGDLKGQSMDLMRFSSSNTNLVPGPIIKDGGWHFSYLGGADSVRDKIGAMPYQGLRAEIAKLFSRLKPNYWARAIHQNNDILLANRSILPVEIDATFPESILTTPEFVQKYRRPK